MQNLYLYISLGDFARNWNQEAGTFTVHLEDVCIRAAQQGDIPYGLKLLREAFKLYETNSKIKLNSKGDIPFFRDNQARLVGPEMILFIQSLFEKKEVPGFVARAKEPWLRISLDYTRLAEYCLTNDFYLIRCKYNREKNIQQLADRISWEYGSIFYTEREIGFKPGSRFFSLLYNATLEMLDPKGSKNPEWRIAVLLPPDQAEYSYENGTLRSYFELDLPTDSILEIQLLPDYRTQIANYTNLIGLLKKMGIKAEEVVAEMKD